MNEELGDLFEIWTPGYILEYINNVSAGYAALVSDFKASPLDAPNMKAFTLLASSFLKFQNGANFISRLSLGTLRTAEEYARQLAYWRDIYKTRIGKPPTGALVSIPADAQAATLNTLAMLVGGGIAVYFAVNVMQVYKLSRSL